MRKKLLLMLMAIVTPLWALAFEIANGDNYTLVYNVLDEDLKTCELQGFSSRNWDWSDTIDVPSTVTDPDTGISYTVTRVGGLNWWNITGIKLPSTITEINDWAFENTQIESIIIPESVTRMGSQWGCDGNPFSNCSKLTSITIKAGNPRYKMEGGALIDTQYNGILAAIGNATIPSDIKIIGSQAFHGNSSIKNITIPATVTEIGYGAFRACENLESVKIESEAIPYLNSTFENCPKLTKLEIPSSVRELYGVFQNSGITEFTIPKNVTYIGGYLLYGCEGEITITSKIKNPTDIDENAFVKSSTWEWDEEGNGQEIKTYFTDLKLFVPKGTKEAYEAAAGWNKIPNTNIVEADIPDEPAIGDELVYESSEGTMRFMVTSVKDKTCKLRQSYWDEENQKEIPSYNKESTSLTLPSTVDGYTVTAIEDEAVCWNWTLREVFIPKTIVSLGERFLYGCGNLESIIVEDGNPLYNSKGDCNALIETATNKLIIGAKNSTIPEGVVEIADYAFQNRQITSIELPSTLKTIGSNAFSGSTLTSIELPSSITTIGDHAFYSVGNLKTVISNLETPLALDADDEIFLHGSWNYETNQMEQGNPDVLYVPQGTKAKYEAAAVWQDFKEIKELVPGAIVFADPFVKELCINAGYDADGNAVYPNEERGVTVVTPWDANGDGELTEEEAAAITNIGTVFNPSSNGIYNKYYSSFDEFKYFTGVTTIPSNAFPNSIPSFYIPKGVKEIEDNAINWYNIQSLTVDPENTAFILEDNVLYTKDKTELIVATSAARTGDFTVPTTVTKIGAHAFAAANDLKSITMPNTVTYIGDNAFEDCYKLAQFDLPTSLTYLGSYAIGWCDKFENAVKIPNSVTYVGDGAFWSTNVPEFYLPETEEPIKTGWNAFNTGREEAATVHSPLAHLGYYALNAARNNATQGKVVAQVTPVNKTWTFASAVDVILPEGVDAYIAKVMNNAQVGINKIEESELTIDDQRVLKGYNGVLLMGEAGKTYDIVAKVDDATYQRYRSWNYDAKSYGSDNQLQPVTVSSSYDASLFFVLSNNAFHPLANSEEKVPAGKAVLYAPGLDSSATRGFLEIVGGEDGTTAIDATITDGGNDSWYDLQGNRIQAPAKKGLYIKNGKKVIIK